jgi:hypothetical protein
MVEFAACMLFSYLLGLVGVVYGLYVIVRGRARVTLS